MKNVILMLVVLFVAACAPQTAVNGTNDTNNDTQNPSELFSTPEVVIDMEAEEGEPIMRNFAATVEYTEGDLVQLQTRAVDPDGDNVEILYGEPLGGDGSWQTEIGDAGEYVVRVEATDTRGAMIEQEVLLRILHANRAPQLSGPDTVQVREGEVVEIPVTATDADGDEVIISFSGWMQSNTHRTTHDDAGEHNVTVIAEDGELETRKLVRVTVENVNRAPVIELPARSFETTELQDFSVEATATDPDGDAVELTFSEPLNDDGTWTPQLDDDGQYTVTVVASDGTDTSREEFELSVLRTNRAPVIKIADDDAVLNYNEGDLINLRTVLDITDEEADEVAVTYHGWMNGAIYQTNYDDAGEHTVTILAEDGAGNKVSENIKIVVRNTNRPPVFTRPA